MAARRPLVVGPNNRLQQLPDGDTVAGVPLYALAYQRGGQALKLAMATALNALPVITHGGGTLYIQVVING